MSLKKFSEVLQTAMELAGFENQTEFQKKAISKYKEGKDFIGIGPDGCGKTTSIVTGVIQKLGDASDDDAPRAVVVVKDKESALELEAEFARLGRRTELRVVVTHDKGKKVHQRIDLYLGADIVIGTGKRLFEMYHQNGLNTGNVKIFVIDDAEEIFKAGLGMQINRLSESIQKCQYVVLNNKLTDRVKNASASFMFLPSLIEIKEEEPEEN
ncbi:DEAD/DEAH box helicase [Crocinitomicaceae bacterium]|nr:DEAD/DEAH box helicase [Crocinitomicaceae bacterium]